MINGSDSSRHGTWRWQRSPLLSVEENKCGHWTSASASKSRELLGLTRLLPPLFGKQMNAASPDTHKSCGGWRKEGGKFFRVASFALTTPWIFQSCFCCVPCLPNLNVLYLERKSFPCLIFHFMSDRKVGEVWEPGSNPEKWPNRERSGGRFWAKDAGDLRIFFGGE